MGMQPSMNAGMTGSPASKRRTHADNIPDSEKPFACDRESFVLLPALPYSEPSHVKKCVCHLFYP